MMKRAIRQRLAGALTLGLLVAVAGCETPAPLGSSMALEATTTDMALNEAVDPEIVDDFGFLEMEEVYEVAGKGNAKATPKPAKPLSAKLRVKIFLDETIHQGSPLKVAVADVSRLVLSVRQPKGTLSRALPVQKLRNGNQGSDLVLTIDEGDAVLTAAAYNAKNQLVGRDVEQAVLKSTRMGVVALELTLKAPPTPAPPKPKPSLAPKSPCS